jgi:hypothetical protein
LKQLKVEDPHPRVGLLVPQGEVKNFDLRRFAVAARQSAIRVMAFTLASS